MKIIDLYNMVANDEELPTKIKLKDFEEIYTLREDCTGYKWYGEINNHTDFERTIHQNLEYVLKQEAEIIEEEKKIPEKLYGIVNPKEGTETVPSNEQLMFKINEIIDCLDYLKNKGE